VRSFLVLATCAVLGLTQPREALAQGPAPNEETARIAFTEGLRLRDEEKNAAAALDKLRAAYKLVPTHRTSYELGLTYLSLGDLLAAQRLFVEVGRMPEEPRPSVLAQKAREQAQRLEAELEGRIPAIRVVVQGAAPGHEPEVKVDGTLVPAEALPLPWKVNPGVHSISVASAGSTQTGSVTVEDGSTAEARFELAAAPVDAPAGNAPGDGQHVGPADAWRPQRTTALVVGGAGVVALGVGSVLGLSAKSTYDGAACGMAAHASDPNACTGAGLSDRTSAGTKADVSTVLFVVGTLAAAGGVVLWLTAPRPAGATTLGLVVTPGGAALRGVLP